MEKLHSLVGYKNLYIFQNTKWFLFSLDSILLAHFVTIPLQAKNILDMGTGNAPIPLILSRRTKAKLYAVEIQEEVVQLAQKSVLYNHLEHQITIIHDDIKHLRSLFSDDFFDVITFNPPYFKWKQGSHINDDIHKTIARHEVKITLEEAIRVAFSLLKTGGILSLVYRSERFSELLVLLEKYHFQPKKLQFIYSKEGKESQLFLLEAAKNGNVGLKILPPLYVHNEDGSYKEEIIKMMGDNYDTKEL